LDQRQGETPLTNYRDLYFVSSSDVGPLNVEEMFAMVSLMLCSFWLHLLFSVKKTP